MLQVTMPCETLAFSLRYFLVKVKNKMMAMLKVFLFESEGDKESTTCEIWYRDLFTEQTFTSRMKYRSGVRSYKHGVGENLHTR
jgi:hypothetical protein